MAGKKWSRCLLFSSALLLVSLADSQERPKVGLVLSGGGAKGVAHVPILKLLDELDFPVDCIAGTSVGGIMGGLYAAGYSGAEIEQFFAGADWLGLFSDRPPRGRQPFFEKRLDGRYQLEFPLRKGLPYAPRGLVAGQNFYNLFSSLLFPLPGDLDFDDLPIPFRCLAVDIVTGNQVILESGSLPRALRATMAIPTLLAPVQWGECLLVDGGLLNNLPVDVLSDLGAEIIIAVDLACPLSPAEDLSTADKILAQSLQVLDVEQKKGKMDKVDILIQPDMKGLSSTDYFFPDRMARIRRRGEEAARLARPALQALKEEYGLRRSPERHAAGLAGRGQTRVLGKVVFAGNRRIPSSFIGKLFGLKQGDVVDAARIARGVDELYSLRYFEDITYEVFPSAEGTVDLCLGLRELPGGNFRVGLRYDTYHKLVAAAGVYATSFALPGLRLETELEAAGLTRIITKLSYPTETLSFPVYPLAYGRYQDIPTRLYGGDGRSLAAYRNRSFGLGAGLGFLLQKSLDLELVYELERMNVGPRPELAAFGPPASLDLELRKVGLRATLDTLDNRLAPRSGLLFQGRYEGSYSSLGSEAAFELAEASLDFYGTVRRKNTFRLYGYWGDSRGEVPFYKYLNQGRPATFVGMAYDELQADAMRIVRGDYIYNYTDFVRLKLMVNLAFGVKARRAEAVYSPGTLWGAGLGVAVNTPLGLLELTYALGSKGLGNPKAGRSVVYLELGARF